MIINGIRKKPPGSNNYFFVHIILLIWGKKVNLTMIKRKSCTTGKVGNQNSSGAACYFLEATEESLNSVMIFVG